MFTNLLESRGKKPRSVGGSLASLAAHAAIIVVAIQATLDAGQASIEAPLNKVVFAAEPVEKPAAPQRSILHTDAKPPTGVLTLNIVNVPDQLPDVELPTRATHDGDTFDSSVPDGRGVRIFDAHPNGIYLASQVDEPVVAVPGSASPKYPEMLRAAGVQGEVVATFVVDTTGRVDPSSFVILKETDDLFGAAVRSALRAMRFIPAKADGRKVRQQVQQPFVFTIIK